MDFNLEQLKLIRFWGEVADSEMTLDEEHSKLLKEIKDYLETWCE